MKPEDRSQVRWSAAIVNHGDYAELARCLTSLSRQDRPPNRVCVYDTGEDALAFEEVRSEFGEAEFEMGTNRGYSGAANRLIDRLIGSSHPVPKAGSREAHPGSVKTSVPDFVLILNSDIELDPDFASQLTDAMTDDEGIAIGGGKLLRPDRETLDSAGIVLPRNRRPVDRGSEQRDHGQFDRAETLGAVSGAAMMLRVSAVDRLRIDGEIFDEAFFAYHEDTDLCWRARNLGFLVGYFPSATAIHHRGWRKSGRFDVPIAIRRHSFKNYYLQLMKNETLQGALLNAPWLIVWEILRFGFVLLRDRELLSGYAAAFRLVPDAWRKRKQIAAMRASIVSPRIQREHHAKRGL